MASIHIFLLLWNLVSIPLYTSAEKACGCYLTNSSSAAYFTNHIFFDFRNLSDYADEVPDVIDDAGDSTDANVTSDYFFNDSWAKAWSIQNWNNTGGDGKLSGDSTVLMVNSPSNIYIESNDDSHADSDTYMTMRTSRLDDFQTTAEFQSAKANFHYVSLRMLARTTGAAGAVTAMFTYRDSQDLKDVQEADIEILTDGPADMIQYTNQPSYTADGDDIPRATSNATLPRGKLWTDWLVHRLDWTPGHSVWYVDGIEAAHIEFQVPRDAAGINFNVWSDGGSWSGNMTKGDETVMQIKWIEMVYNTTDDGVQNQKRDNHGGSCSSICSIDNTPSIGDAVPVGGQDDASGDGDSGAIKLGTGAVWLAVALAMVPACHLF